MPTQRIFDQYGGVVSTVTYDDKDKTVTYAQYQDATPILENNKKLKAENPYNPKKDFRRVASVPNVVMLDWLRKDGIRPLDFFRKPKAYEAWLRRKIYDPDNTHVLTAPHKR
jgi:ABC-type glycerol-3-phosphate transport system substrate-binding protein